MCRGWPGAGAVFLVPLGLAAVVALLSAAQAPGTAPRLEPQIASADSEPQDGLMMKVSNRYVHRRLWSLRFNSGALTFAVGGQRDNWRFMAGLDVGMGRSTSGLRAWNIKLMTSAELFSGRWHGGLRLDVGPLILIPVTPGGSDLFSIGGSVQIFGGFDIWRTSRQRAVFLDAQGGVDLYAGQDSVLVPTFGGALGYRF